MVHRLLDDRLEGIVARSHINNAMVEAECDHCPSVWFRVEDSIPPMQDLRWGVISMAYPVMGEAKDADGMTINVILHIINGYVSHLDVHRWDGEAITSLPPPAEFRRVPT